MKKFLVGITLGAVLGAVTLKKMESSKVPEKVLQSAQEKLCEK